jgi:hypothetical protein
MLSSPSTTRSGRFRPSSSHSLSSSLPPTVRRPRPRVSSHFADSSFVIPKTNKRQRTTSSFIHSSHLSPYSLHLSSSSLPVDSSSFPLTVASGATASSKRTRSSHSVNSTLNLPVSSVSLLSSPRSRVISSSRSSVRFPSPPVSHSYSLLVDGLSNSFQGHRRRSFSPISCMSLRSSCLRGSNTLTEFIDPGTSEYSINSQIDITELQRLDDRIIGLMESGHTELDEAFKNHLQTDGWINEQKEEKFKLKPRETLEQEIQKLRKKRKSNC